MGTLTLVSGVEITRKSKETRKGTRTCREAKADVEDALASSHGCISFPQTQPSPQIGSDVRDAGKPRKPSLVPSCLVQGCHQGISSLPIVSI